MSERSSSNEGHTASNRDTSAFAEDELLWWSLIPIRSHSSLVESLSTLWGKLSQSPWLAVASLSLDGKRLHLACQSASRSPRSASIFCPQGKGWSLENVREGLLRCGEKDLSNLESSIVIRLEADSEIIGSVHLPAEYWDAIPRENRSQMKSRTVRCLEQARAVEPPVCEEGDFAERLCQEKLESLAEFAAGAGHEINNPLATISGRAQLLLRGEHDPERRQWLISIGAQAHRVRDMIGDLMLFARPPRPIIRSLNVEDHVQRVVATRRAEASARLCDLTVSTELGINAETDATNPHNSSSGRDFARSVEETANFDKVTICADPVQFASVIAALIDNSLQALRDGGTCHVSVRRECFEGRPWGVVSVSDNGTGLSDLERKHLFDPYFSGRPAGRGLGLGLSKAWRIVTNHEGRLVVKSPGRDGVGTTVTSFWPLEENSPSA